MKVFIIGGTGLISTAVSQALLERGDEVVHFNRGHSPRRGAQPSKLILGDRDDEAALRAALQAERPEALIDMVAYSPGQAEALLRASQGLVPQLVLCSTVCVYGGPLTRLPADENEPDRPVGNYGRAKSAIERLLLSREGQQGQHSTVIRPSFSTGEGATASGLVFDDSMVARLRQGLPVVVMDDGKAGMSIAHVSDVAGAFVGALGKRQAYGQAYNATSSEHSDWNGIFRALAEAAGAPPPDLRAIPSSWLYAQAPKRAVGIEFIFKHAALFDNSKAERDLGFRTTVPLVETFRRQIAWMESQGKIKKTTEETVQDELCAAWAEKRDVVAGRFVDTNFWGDSTVG